MRSSLRLGGPLRSAWPRRRRDRRAGNALCGWPWLVRLRWRRRRSRLYANWESVREVVRRATWKRSRSISTDAWTSVTTTVSTWASDARQWGRRHDPRALVRGDRRKWQDRTCRGQSRANGKPCGQSLQVGLVVFVQTRSRTLSPGLIDGIRAARPRLWRRLRRWPTRVNAMRLHDNSSTQCLRRLFAPDR